MRLTLCLKINLIIFGVLVILFSASGIYDYINLKNEFQKKLEVLSKNIGERMSNSIAEPLWNSDTDLLANLVKYEMVDEVLKAVIIYDTSEEAPVFAKMVDEKGAIVDIDDTKLTKTILKKFEPTKEGELAGRLELHFTDAPMQRSLKVQTNKVIYKACVFALLILLALILTIRLMVDRPIKRVIKVFDDMTENVCHGNIDTETDACTAGVHFKGIIDGYNRTLEEVERPIKEAMFIMAKLANKDLTGRMEKEYEGKFEEFSENINKAANNLEEALTVVREAVFLVQENSGKVSSFSQGLSQGATQQAAALEEISSSMQEISNQVNNNAKRAKEARNFSDEVHEGASEGNLRMKEIITAMDDIMRSSENINKIIKVIENIAFQTNLLALNAAVESARAGIHGKGFAVVAEEVRTLASRSTSAAKETTELITKSLKNIETGHATVNAADKVFSRILTGVTDVNKLITEIATDSDSQANAVLQIRDALRQVDQVTQNSAMNAQNSAVAANDLANESKILHDLVHNFRISG